MPTDAPFTSYDQSGTLHKRIVPDVISLIDPVEVQFLLAVGGLDGARSKFDIRMNGRQIEWLTDAYRTMASTLAATLATDTTAVTVSDSSVHRIGDVVQLTDGAELANVTSNNTSTNVITVTRGFGGTTQATQATGAIDIQTVARIEGADADSGQYETVGSDYNVTQILQDEVAVTGTQQALDLYGITNTLEYQRRKIIPEQTRFLNKAALRNSGISTGSATAARLLKGLPGYLTTNTLTTDRTDFNMQDLRTLTLSSYQNGGNVDMLVMNPITMDTIAAFLDSSEYLRVDVSEGRVGMHVKQFVTPFATYMAVPDRWAPNGAVFGLDSRHVGFYQLRPFMEEGISKVGDSEKIQIVGEFSFAVKHESAHFYITLT